MTLRSLLIPEARRSRLLVRGLLAGLAVGTAGSPVMAQVLVGDGSITCGAPYVVAGGDTLSRLAQRAYGDPMLYGPLADANADLLGGNPERLAVGMSIQIPCLDASGAELTPEQAAQATASIQAAVAAEGPLDAAELDALFGPVALFPDQVLTPVLVAVTFPLDIVKAGRFVEEAQGLTDQQRAAGAADQTWDESVRELAAGFPDLVTRMSDNIDWTEQAGEAVVAQTDEVLASIQRLRAKAQENGYLVDNEAQKVEEVNDKIVIASSNPNVVYVPTYDSQVVYTTPVVGTPVYHYGYDDDDDWDEALVAGGIILGGAIILDEIFDDDDWHGWDIDDDIDWDGGDITIDRGDIDIDRGDINIDRDDINIDRDNINIGDGDRTALGGGGQLGDGGRVSIGDAERTQIDRSALAERAGDAPRAGTLPADRKSIANTADRDVARQKIETRKSTGAPAAKLPSSRLETARPAAANSRAVTQQRPAANRSAPVTRPATQQRPSAARAPSRSNTFQKPSGGGHRATASSNRGHASRGGGGRGGGGRGGGGRR